MTNVYLKGRLGREFGETWTLEAKTPREALHAINVNTDGRFVRFIQESSKANNVGYAFMVGDHKIDSRDKIALMEGPHGKTEDIVVTPIIGGSGGIVESIIISLIVSLITAVVSAMLAPSPNVDLGSNSDVARKDSYLFSGGPQPARQGKPVPVGYGRMIVYPIPISVQYDYSQVGTGTPAADFVGGNNYNDWGSSGGYYDMNGNYQQNQF